MGRSWVNTNACRPELKQVTPNAGLGGPIRSLTFGKPTARSIITQPFGAGGADGPCPGTALGVAVDADGRSLGDINLDCDTALDDYRLFQLGFDGPSN